MAYRRPGLAFTNAKWKDFRLRPVLSASPLGFLLAGVVDLKEDARTLPGHAREGELARGWRRAVGGGQRERCQPRRMHPAGGNAGWLPVGRWLVAGRLLAGCWLAGGRALGLTGWCRRRGGDVGVVGMVGVVRLP